MMKIKVNGQEKEVSAQSVKELVNELGMSGKPVVVEYNEQALVASAHAQTQLSEGDCLEILVLGAGG